MLIPCESFSRIAIPTLRRCWHYVLSGGPFALYHTNFVGAKTMFELFTKIQHLEIRDTEIALPSHRGCSEEDIQFSATRALFRS